jgi:hypothetical protein
MSQSPEEVQVCTALLPEHCVAEGGHRPVHTAQETPPSVIITQAWFVQATATAQ